MLWLTRKAFKFPSKSNTEVKIEAGKKQGKGTTNSKRRALP